jgi:hypothetical protein
MISSFVLLTAEYTENTERRTASFPCIQCIPWFLSLQQRRQVHGLGFLPDFRGANRQPKLGFDNLKRTAGG